MSIKVDIKSRLLKSTKVDVQGSSAVAYSHNGRAPKRPRTKKAARPLQPATTKNFS